MVDEQDLGSLSSVEARGVLSDPSRSTGDDDPLLLHREAASGGDALRGCGLHNMWDTVV
jgi:hypothetical protein